MIAFEKEYRDALVIAYKAAVYSPDPSTQNAAVLIQETEKTRSGSLILYASGINTFPARVKESDERLVRPLKYEYIEHAERNAIYNAANIGVKTHGLTMVCCWAACTDCARAIIQSGIKRLVRHQDATDRSPDNWLDSIKIADGMLGEAGVEIINISGPVNAGVEVLHSGNLWTP